MAYTPAAVGSGLAFTPAAAAEASLASLQFLLHPVWLSLQLLPLAGASLASLQLLLDPAWPPLQLLLDPAWPHLQLLLL